VRDARALLNLRLFQPHDANNNDNDDDEGEGTIARARVLLFL
jgi:hypothetical protein